MHNERRGTKEIEEKVENLHEELHTLKERLESKIDQNNESIKTLKEDLKPAIEVWTALTGVVTTLKWIGTAAKWVGIVVGTVVALITLGAYKKTGG